MRETEQRELSAALFLSAVGAAIGWVAIAMDLGWFVWLGGLLVLAVGLGGVLAQFVGPRRRLLAWALGLVVLVAGVLVVRGVAIGEPGWEGSADARSGDVVITDSGDSVEGHALDDGEKLWSGNGDLLAVVGDVVVVRRSSTLVGVDAKSGDQLWAQDVPGTSAPLHHDGVLVVASYGDIERTTGIDLASGDVRWEHAGTTLSPESGTYADPGEVLDSSILVMETDDAQDQIRDVATGKALRRENVGTIGYVLAGSHLIEWREGGIHGLAAGGGEDWTAMSVPTPNLGTFGGAAWAERDSDFLSIDPETGTVAHHQPPNGWEVLDLHRTSGAGSPWVYVGKGDDRAAWNYDTAKLVELGSTHDGDDDPDGLYDGEWAAWTTEGVDAIGNEVLRVEAVGPGGTHHGPWTFRGKAEGSDDEEIHDGVLAVRGRVIELD